MTCANIYNHDNIYNNYIKACTRPIGPISHVLLDNVYHNNYENSRRVFCHITKLFIVTYTLPFKSSFTHQKLIPLIRNLENSRNVLFLLSLYFFCYFWYCLLIDILQYKVITYTSKL